MKKILIVLIFFNLTVFAQQQQRGQAQYQDHDQIDKQFEEILKARKEIMRSLLDDSMSEDLEKKMQEMMKRFGQEDFSQNFFSQDFNQLGGERIGEYDWVVTDIHRILKIKVTQEKDHPLDIKIEKGMIKIKGNVEINEEKANNGKNQKIKAKRIMSFERSFSLPEDIDQNNPVFENKEKEGELLIKFPKLISAKGSKKEMRKAPEKNTGKQQVEERLPVPPSNHEGTSI